MELRRFRPKTTDLHELMELIDRKQLTREDVYLILSTLEINPNVSE